MEDIAAASGITKLIVYRHFDSKEELYRAVLQRVFDRLAEEFLVGIRSAGDDGVGARALLAAAREDPAGFQLLWRHAAREPQFADYSRELREHAVDASRALLAPWVAPDLRGVGRPDDRRATWWKRSSTGSSTATPRATPSSSS